jgi:hypothetical protein
MAKHKYIETPAKMWQLFTEYKNSIKNNPIRKQIFVGKDGHCEYEERERPLTMEGFENYVADLDIMEDLGHYFSNNEGRYDNYRTICSRIKRTIKQCQIEGGMAGIYNPSITQRLNGLTEKVQQDGTNDITIKVKYERSNDKLEPAAPGTGKDIE